MAPPHGDMGWSAVCVCGISLSYSLTFPLVTRMLAMVVDIQKWPEGEIRNFLRQATKSRNIDFTEAISR